MEVEMSTAPWHRIVCVCNYADQCRALYLFYLFSSRFVQQRWYRYWKQDQDKAGKATHSDSNSEQILTAQLAVCVCCHEMFRTILSQLLMPSVL